MSIYRITFAFAIICGLAVSASAIDWTFNDLINQGQEVPPTGSPATGNATGAYDDITNALVINVTASGFLSDRTAAHIHFAPAGQNGGVQFDLGVAGAGSNYTNVNSNFVLSNSQETDFLNGHYYVNIHTQTNPGGSIRGQLNPVPEPATMIALGIGSIVMLRRRKRQ